jgi:carbon-monoxide dehydrogenase medium subunit
LTPRRNQSLKPPAFDYVRPSTVDEAVALLADSEQDAKVLAGGQSLIPLLNFRLAFPTRLVDVKGIHGLDYIRVDGDHLRIGATTLTRSVELSPEVARVLPILTEACHWVGHVQIRNRGTVGGSIAHADPSAEIPALSVLLDAELKVRSNSATRIAASNGFFQGFLSTGLEKGELLEEIAFPIPNRQARWGFREFAVRRGDFALAGAACVLSSGNDGTIEDARAVVFGATDFPVRVAATENDLRGKRLTGDVIEAAARSAGVALQAETNGDADRAYRVEVAEVMLRRALDDAMSEGKSGGGGQ